jgi:hypothetical protein
MSRLEWKEDKRRKDERYESSRVVVAFFVVGNHCVVALRQHDENLLLSLSLSLAHPSL